MTQRLVVAISGASGALCGIRALELLRLVPGLEVHLVLSQAAAATIALETDYHVEQVAVLADVVHDNANVGAAIASGSFRTLGMIVAPCSIKSLAAIAHSFSTDLLSRAGDVCLKERRPLVLMVRETPLHRGHLELMQRAAMLGAIIAPPVPAFYKRPHSILDMVDDSVRRALGFFGLDLPGAGDGWSSEQGAAAGRILKA
ncbi:MAG: UbiX family flavin prenyltransferase [Alphaproteobacteria bacterium]|nr:MAG: UbiX family flavin prenyltransferase [Alphaproteobacteria bacterium]